MKNVIMIVILVVTIAVVGYFLIQNKSDQISTMVENSTLSLSSPAFENGASIPSKFTCDGNDLSPELSISGVPEGAQSLALIMDDPDAPVGTWDHWIVFNISPNTTAISEGEEPRGLGGKNSWGNTGYGGPCPPSGEHRYFFKLYALDITIKLSEGSTKGDIEKAMEGHVMGSAELIGVYSRVSEN